MRLLFCVLLALSSAAGRSAFAESTLPPASARRLPPTTEALPAPQRFVIGLSPFLDRGAVDDVYRALVRLMVQDLPLDSTVSVYDAYNLKTIAKVAIPANRAFNSAKTRANQFAPAIHDLKQFLASAHPPPPAKRLDFKNAVRLPQFWDFLCETMDAERAPTTVLLFGSPLYQDAQEPGFSMADGYFPSDGHLRAARESTVYGLPSRPSPGTATLVHWVYFGDPWLNELHREKITRFWTLYLEQRNARLGTFTSDFASAVDAFRQGPSLKLAAAIPWTLDESQSKIEMLRVTREVPGTDWLLQSALSDTAQQPPAVLVGRMKIGIRWKDNLDLDLYATPRPGAETLFFQHPHSPEGYYYHDHRSSPGREYEFIEFESPVDARQVEAFVNFYQGTCPAGPRVEVRIEFDNRIYGGTVSLSATEGNRGRTGPGQEEYWVRIPLQQILKLPFHAAAR